MNSRFLFALVLLAAVVCVAWAQGQQQGQQQAANPNCPIQRTKAALSSMQQAMQRMTQQARQALGRASQSGQSRMSPSGESHRPLHVLALDTTRRTNNSNQLNDRHDSFD